MTNMGPQPLSNTNLKSLEVNDPTNNNVYTSDTNAPKYNENDANESKIIWFNVSVYTVLHGLALYGLWLASTLQVSWKTLLCNYIYMVNAGVGITGGAHRLWSHRAYKAKLPLRIFLMLGQTAALQNDIYEWVRDHRVHHKFTDTDADPHNSSRGFFFCHIGWLLMKKHEDVKIKGKTIDMSDVAADPVVKWQRKYYVPLTILFTFVIPTFAPCYFWGEAIMKSFHVCILRYVWLLNSTWSVNSAAHLWGYKPYDQTMKPVENKYVSTFVFGEGWHNYHHTFPWDYKAAELGNYSMNWTTGLLDLMAYLGQAYDLRTVSEELIRKRANRTGDGSWKDGNINLQAATKKKIDDHHIQEEYIWGWDDKDMKDDDKKHAQVYNNTN